MQKKSSKLLRFWDEQKRRKVIKVIAILCIGFPIAFIFSWIFDINSEWLKKTESVEAMNEEALQDLSDFWDLRPSYNHEGYLHIQAAEKAVAK